MISPLVLLWMPTITWKQSTPSWWCGTEDMRSIFTCIADAGWWLDFGYESTHGARPFRTVESLESAFASTSQWKAGSHTFSLRKGKEALACFLGLNVTDDGLDVRLGVQLDLLDTLRRTWIDQLVKGVTCLHDMLRDLAWFGLPMNVLIEGFKYRRPRPPRRNPTLGASGLVDFVSLRYHEHSEMGNAEVVRILQNASLPPGVERDEANGLVVVQWVRELTDEEHIAECLSKRERWINTHLNPPIESFYNEFGDRAIIPFGLAPRPPLTFYTSAYRRGYKAIFVDKDGRANNHELAELESYVQQGQLPDGSPLDELILIAPDRARAIALRDRALRMGASAVYYPSEDGSTWFDPFPPGIWLDDERSNAS